eukprot:TRINITY_DN112575_c0_g1_i1.p1 TRINITY_DN112575_c0_g1~~TRINITY_DN112575_c0_g1_i1.p1  ORF type:complete len:418 (-),score=108.18 TRINITY_DN112575_c0_g1_i1:69-1184(-)
MGAPTSVFRFASQPTGAVSSSGRAQEPERMRSALQRASPAGSTVQAAYQVPSFNIAVHSAVQAGTSRNDPLLKQLSFSTNAQSFASGIDSHFDFDNSQNDFQLGGIPEEQPTQAFTGSAALPPAFAPAVQVPLLAPPPQVCGQALASAAIQSVKQAPLPGASLLPLAASSQADAQPPVRSRRSTGGIADNAKIEQQKASYLRKLEAQLQEAIRQLKETCAAQKAALRKAAETQKQEYNQKVDSALQAQKNAVVQEFNSEAARLLQAANAKKASVQKQADVMVQDVKAQMIKEELSKQWQVEEMAQQWAQGGRHLLEEAAQRSGGGNNLLQNALKYGGGTRIQKAESGIESGRALFAHFEQVLPRFQQAALR